MDQKLDDILIKRRIKTPIGFLELHHNGNAVTSLSFDEHDININHPSEKDDFGDDVQKQLESYFKGKLKEFDLKIEQKATDFQKKVWNELLQIPFGKHISYSDLALQMGNPLLTRAVASANGQNKILILIPCHRVIGKNGKLTGYSGGIDRKKWLLNHEANLVENKMLLF